MPQGPTTAVAAAVAASPCCAAASLRCNWDAFWGAVAKDHCHAGLIWNERTRAELREALQVGRSGFSVACFSVVCVEHAHVMEAFISLPA